MKIWIKVILLLVLSVSGTLASGKDAAVIVISPYLSKQDRALVRNQVTRFVLLDAKMGASISVVNGWSGSTVASFVIPILNIDSPTARQLKIRAELGALIRWFNENQSAPDQLLNRGSLNTPILFTSIERLNPKSVLLIGSPVYIDPGSPEHSWYQVDDEKKGYWYPSDASFFAVGGLSPWGVDEKRRRLGDARVHWLTVGDTEYASDRYAERIRRFYGIYCDLEGGSLVSFLGDPNEAFKGLFRTDLKPYVGVVDTTHTKIVMKRPGSVVAFSKESDIEETVAIPLNYRAKPITRVFLVDITMSMEKYYSKVAREIAKLPKGENMLLVTFSDHYDPRVYTIFEESDDPSEIARALRSIELVAGEDEPEAMGDALHAVRKELEARGVKHSIDITVWSDAPAKEVKDVPTGIDCIEEMNSLMEQGHRITLVKCRTGQSVDWLPARVETRVLGK